MKKRKFWETSETSAGLQPVEGAIIVFVNFQSFCLTEERKFVMVPGPGSGVPGAPAGDYDHIPDGMEQHSPVLFLDLNADDLSTGELTVTSVQK